VLLGLEALPAALNLHYATRSTSISRHPVGSNLGYRKKLLPP